MTVPAFNKDPNQHLNQNSLTLSDLITGDPNLIVMSNYLISPDFIISKIPLFTTTPTLILDHGRDNGQGFNRDTPFCSVYPHIKRHYPKVGGFGCHHAKFIIAFYPSRGVRVCIFTANFIPRDWGNMSNGIYVQDFPLKSAVSPPPPTHKFETTLTNYLKVALSGEQPRTPLPDLIPQHQTTPRWSALPMGARRKYSHKSCSPHQNVPPIRPRRKQEADGVALFPALLAQLQWC